MGLKVTAGLHSGIFIDTATGRTFHPNAGEKIYIKEEFFRERIILDINAIAGDNWSVQFVEYPVSQPTFFVDITAEEQYLLPIAKVIANAFPDIELRFWKLNPYVLFWTRKAHAA